MSEKNKVYFSRNLYDKDGDVFDECIMIYNQNFAIRFDSLGDLKEFLESLESVVEEVSLWDD